MAPCWCWGDHEKYDLPLDYTHDHGPPTLCPSGTLWYHGHAAAQSVVPARSSTARALGGVVPGLHGELSDLASCVSSLSGSVWL